MRRLLFLSISSLSLWSLDVAAQPLLGDPQPIAAATPGIPFDVVTGDVDGDGLVDVVASMDEREHVVLIRGRRGGGFHDPQPFLTLGAGKARLALGDLDGDADLDLVVADVGEHAVVWLENDGTGRFGTQTVVNDDAWRPRKLTLADIDADGTLDIAVVLGGEPLPGTVLGWESRLEWHRGDGNGGFGPRQPVQRQVGSVDPNEPGTYDDLWYAEFDDLDGDSDLDLILGHRKLIREVYRNDGGTFTMTQIVFNSSSRSNVTLLSGDFDGDGDTDLLMPSADVRFFANDGSGQFGDGVGEIVATGASKLLASADLDGDGRLDAIGTGPYGRFLLGLNLGVDTLAVIQLPESLKGTARLHDMNGDGRLDLIGWDWAKQSIWWSPNQLGTGAELAFGEAQTILSPDVLDVMVMELADLDADGDLDVFNVERDGSFVWFENGGKGRFGPPQTVYEQRTQFWSAAIGDLNGDSFPDVVAMDLDRLNPNGSRLWSTLNDGTGRFPESLTIDSVPHYAQQPRLVDLNADNQLDLVIASTYENILSWYPGLGTGAFSESEVLATLPDQISAMIQADLDGDGDDDLVVAYGYRESGLVWFETLGDGRVKEREIHATSSTLWFTPFAYDADGDGDLDLAVVRIPKSGSPQSRGPLVLMNDGSGAFTESPEYQVRNQRALGPVGAIDLSGDGQLSLLLRKSRGPLLELIPGDPNGDATDANGGATVREVGNAPEGLNWRSIHVGDIDGDRQFDVVAGFYPIDELMWYPNPLAVATEAEVQVVEELGFPAPNPFTASSTLTFTPEASGPARVTLHDALGRQLEVLFDATVQAGQGYELVIDGAALAPGAYWVRLYTEAASSTRSLVRVR